MFKKYNSIENTYREKTVEQVYLHGYGDETFVVQEKVHGSNFSFITDGHSISVAKRSGLIHEDEKFNNYEYVLNKYKNSVREIFRLVKSLLPETETISIFGELFGGSYEHPEVANLKNMTRIQKGVFYSPENEFYAFDICINQTEYLNVRTANHFFEKTEMFYAKTLFEGDFKSCLAYPNTFESKIPEWLGLPRIEGNVCEGVVIKPVVNRFFKGGSRVIFKNKNEKWSEKTSVKKGTIKKFKGIEALSEKDKETVKLLLGYVNENRLMNVQSKLGEFTPKLTGKFIGLLSQDALTDFKTDHETDWLSVEKEQKKIMTKILNKEATTVVKHTLLFK